MQSYADTNQHYVSQFMLRGFHTGSEAQIWVFDKLTGRSYTDAIRKVAAEYGFYNIAGSLRSNLGLGVPGIEVYLPISGELVLAHMCPSIATVSAAMGEEARRMGFIDARAHSYLQALMNSSPILVGKDDVENLNRLELAYAERWVYSSANNFENARGILEENPRFRTGPRYDSPQKKSPTSSQ